MVKIYSITDSIGSIDVGAFTNGEFRRYLTAYVLKGKAAVLFDVGPTDSLPSLFDGLREMEVSLEAVRYIFLSHVHMDHSGGIGEAVKYMPNARVVAHKKAVPHLLNPERLWQSSLQVLGELAQKYGKPEPVSQGRIITAEDGMTFALGEFSIEVLDTPGHAPHHLSFLEKNENRLFVGEAAGIYMPEYDYLRPATPPPFSLEKMLESLDRLISINPKSMYYAHFGYSESPADLLQSLRRQLLLWGKLISEYIENGTDLKQICDRIKEKDSAISRFGEISPQRQQMEDFYIYNNIRGYLDYFKKKGTDYLFSLI